MTLRLGIAFGFVGVGVGFAVAGVEHAVLAAIFGFFVGKLAVSTTRTLRTK